MFKKIIKEPLVHFLLAGFLLFVYFKITGGDSGLENTITINKEVMLNFMQFQSKAFNREVFDAKFAQFSEIEKQQLLKNYIQEEALYREAVKLGLDQNDFVIKRRIVQKMEFILNDFDESLITISQDSLLVYYQQHQQRYFQPEQYTFAHIFFKAGANESGLKRATAFMESAKHQNLSTTESLPFGDRFLYHRNYAEKTVNFLDSQFGVPFTQALAKMEATEHKWQGPIRSEHGWHWIKLVNQSTAGFSKLADIESIVKADYLGYLKQQHQQQQIERLLKEYNVSIDL
ncbi:MAG: peptidyl-prolyl cis-trans isomerase [Saprospiraceae bacterium]